MPDTSLLSPFVVKLGGGLMLDKDAFTLPPGAATQLQNFEPDINGGYRRINGFAKFNSNIVPQTSASTEKVLGVHIYKDQVIAARGTKVFKGGATGSWTEIDTGRTSAGRYNFVNFNFDGTDKVVFVDGANLASVFNNTSVTDVSASGRPADAQFVEVFRSHVFYAGMSASPQELIFSVPFDEDDFTSGSGAGSIKVDGIIKGIKVFRESLFVFCEDSIFKITGSSLSDFAVVPVTRKIGCVDGFSIQEISIAFKIPTMPWEVVPIHILTKDPTNMPVEKVAPPNLGKTISLKFTDCYSCCRSQEVLSFMIEKTAFSVAESGSAKNTGECKHLCNADPSCQSCYYDGTDCHLTTETFDPAPSKVPDDVLVTAWASSFSSSPDFAVDNIPYFRSFTSGV